MKGARRRRLRDQYIRKRLRELANTCPDIVPLISVESGRLAKTGVGAYIQSWYDSADDDEPGIEQPPVQESSNHADSRDRER